MCSNDILPTLLKLKSKGIMWYLAITIVAWQNFIGSLTQREEWYIIKYDLL